MAALIRYVGMQSDGDRQLRTASRSRICSVMLVGLAAVALLPASIQAQSAGDSVGVAAAALRAGNYPAAIEATQRGLRAHPQDARLYTVQGMAYSMSGDDAAALRALHSALRISPAYPPALQAEAQILFRQGSPDAEPALHAILHANPQDVTAREMLAVTEAREGQCESADADFRMTGTALDTHAESLLRYGGCLFQQNDFEGAVGVFTKLAALQPASRDVQYDLALAEARAGQEKAAATRLQPLLGADADVATLTLAADVFEAIEDTPQAVALLRRAIVLAPDRAATYVQFAEVCMSHESDEAGIAMLNAGIARMPKEPSLFLARGMLYGGLAQYSRAEADFQTAEALNPQKGTGVYGVGMMQLQGNQDAQALATVRAGLRAHPQNAELHFLLARILVDNGARPGDASFTEALASAKEAVRLDPSLLGARDQLAILSLQAGDATAAIAQCHAALALDPEDQTAMYHLMLASRKTGDTAAVEQLARRLAALHQQSRDDESSRLRYRITQSNKPPSSP